MSNFLGPAHVTMALKRRLTDFVLLEVTSGLVGADLEITTLRPDKVTDEAKARINIYLYQATPNTHWRNGDLPTRNADAAFTQRARAAMDLHYLLTFYGDDFNLAAHHLMASTARVLHEKPWFTSEQLIEAKTGNLFLANSNLEQEQERVKFTPTALGVDEISKLWAAFPNTPYNLSLTYSASVLFIERDEAVASPKLVFERDVQVGTIGSGAPSPGAIGGLGLWLRADKGLSAQLVRSTETPEFRWQWLDQSGRGRNVDMQLDAVRTRRRLALNALGKRPAVHFQRNDDVGDPANDQIQLEWINATSFQAITVCVVHRTTVIGTQALIGFGPVAWELGIVVDPDPALAPTALGCWTTNSVVLRPQRLPIPEEAIGPAARAEAAYGYADLGDGWRIQIASYEADVSKELRIDAAQVAQTTVPPAGPIAANTQRCTIGATAGLAGANRNAFEGDIAEIIIYERAIDAQERATLYRYLRDQYGLP